MSNNTADFGYIVTGSNISSFGYGIGVSVGILFLITTITLASYFCTRNQTPSPSLNQTLSAGGSCVAEIGLDEKTLLSYPKVLFSQCKVSEKKDCTASYCCSICLTDYKSSDLLRLLPECGHLFHLKCVDPWLRLHPTCPVCRTSPLPTPQPTPLGEAVPLASS